MWAPPCIHALQRGYAARANAPQKNRKPRFGAGKPFISGVSTEACSASERPRPSAQRRIARSLRALPMTLTDESAMAAAAMAGDSSQPKAG